MGRSLRLARELADLGLFEAATRAGFGAAQLEALESGNVGRQHDRIETLRALRAYANSLVLPGDDYVLIAIEEWPSIVPLSASSGDTAVVPVVSISSAPAGGHSPVGGRGFTWPGDATGVADATTTGVIESILPLSLHDTGQVRIVDTGEVPAVTRSPPRALKVLVGITAFLVVLGGAALVEHAHIEGWVHDGRSSTTHWYHEVKSALGFSSKPSTSTSTHHSANGQSQPPATTAKVTVKPNPAGNAATFDVAASSFTVKIVATNAPCWISASTAGHPPLYAGLLLAGQTHVFTVTSAVTIETGSSAGHAFIYQGTKLLGFYFPTKVPFQMTFRPSN
jgi:hypothetical protein